jgi:hypothetical protein
MRGRNLKTPVTVNIPEPKDDAERLLFQYIIKALVYKMPRLLPFTFNNASMMTLARHSLFHRSGSQSVFYEYARSIYCYCKWLNATPDQLVNECKDEDDAPIPKVAARAERKLDEYALHLQRKTTAPTTVIQHIRCIRTMYRAN